MCILCSVLFGIGHRVCARQAGTGLASGRQEEDEEKEEEGEVGMSCEKCGDRNLAGSQVVSPTAKGVGKHGMQQ